MGWYSIKSIAHLLVQINCNLAYNWNAQINKRES